ncbi:MAG: lipoyl(octanoyl) transferase LipB [Burkholderiaceae bacterium]|nr:lipoyl(octanoyl) transferase LipB [Burkholderiaceae bacterium]
MPRGQPAATADTTALVLRLPGLSDYAGTLDAMREFTRTRNPGTRDQIWLLEHPPVFTLGLAGRREHLFAPGEVPVVATERGGQVTYHGPGQVIAYTLIDLHRKGIGPRELVYRLEQAVIQTLARFGVVGRRVAGAPGIYVAASAEPGPGQGTGDPTRTADAGGSGTTSGANACFAGLAKIAALGVKISRGRSLHGLALNVAMDLSPFDRIDPCGYPGLRVIDLAMLGVNAGPDEVAAVLGERLCAHLADGAGAGEATGR